MTRQELVEQIKHKQSYLCIGLDTDIKKIPQHLLSLPDPIFAFNKEIIDATSDYAVAYKPNIAFYESLGSKGWESLEKTIDYIPKNCFTIADAKRGDIGNTSSLYAKAFFETLNCDAVTIAPYMGRDSVEPFLKTDGKWAIILGLTSNKGAEDFQLSELTEPATGSHKPFLFESVLQKCSSWGTPDNTMFVVGATRADRMQKVRKIVPHHFLLVPGVGAQGGDLSEISKSGFNTECGLLVNSSRQIIYAGSGTDFAIKAAEESKKTQIAMCDLLKEAGIL